MKTKTNVKSGEGYYRDVLVVTPDLAPPRGTVIYTTNN